MARVNEIISANLIIVLKLAISLWTEQIVFNSLFNFEKALKLLLVNGHMWIQCWWSDSNGVIPVVHSCRVLIAFPTNITRKGNTFGKEICVYWNVLNASTNWILDRVEFLCKTCTLISMLFSIKEVVGLILVTK